MSGDGGAAERAPLIDEEEEVQAVDPNLLTLMDCVWIMVHLCFATCDGLALHALLHRRFKGANFFGGHTQFLGNWSLCLSLGSNAVAIYADLIIEPAPKKFQIRQHVHRDKTYYWQAMLAGTVVVFTTMVTVCQTLLLLIGEDKFQRQHLIPDFWLDFGVPGAAWVILIFKKQRHWMGGAHRFIQRKAVLWPVSLACGHTLAHYILWLFIAWTSACRILGGRWVYRAVSAAENETSGVGFFFFYIAVVFGLHLVTWLVWKVAYGVLLILPKPKGQ